MVDWDWDARPTYESERIRIDATVSPLVLYDMRLPRQVEDHEVALMLSIADRHLESLVLDLVDENAESLGQVDSGS